MASDPYSEWLGIPAAEHPPNHYRLLGLKTFESDPNVIDAAATKQIAFVQGRAKGPDGAWSKRLLGEITAARLCLLDALKKAAYDSALKDKVFAVATVKPAVANRASGQADIFAAATIYPATAGASSDQAATGPVRQSAPSSGRLSVAEPSLPEQFGRYRIIKKLGQGGMGAVYLAHDSQLDRRVALKVPTLDADKSSEALGRFYREAKAAATIEHPNICSVYDVGEIDGVLYLTMSFIEGRPLSAFISPDKPLPPRKVAAVVRKIALAFSKAHQKGVIHRDLKPSNIIVNASGEPIVMDFGLARRIQHDERMTQCGAVMGTPAYMSPEQVSGADIGPTSDIYSLGVILYEMLTGKLPFEGAVATILGKIMVADPPSPSQHRLDTDPLLEAICLKAMNKKIEDRYASMGEFANELGYYLQGTQGGIQEAKGNKHEDWAQPAEAAVAHRRRGLKKKPFGVVGTIIGLVLTGIGGSYLALFLFTVPGQSVPESLRFLPGLGGRKELPKQSVVGDNSPIKSRQGSPGSPMEPTSPRKSLSGGETQKVVATEPVTAAPAHIEQAAPPITAVTDRARENADPAQVASREATKRAATPQSANDSPAPVRTVLKRFLSDFQPLNIKVVNGWFGTKGNLGHSMPNGKTRITVDGQPSAFGIALHPDSDDFAAVTFKLGKRWKTFHTVAAIGDASGHGSVTPLTFRVLGDGKFIWTSRPLQNMNETHECDLDVSGVDLLELRVRCPGKNGWAQGIWIDPYLLRDEK